MLPWIHDIVKDLKFESVLDAFSGSGCVSYLFKDMGKQVTANDFLNFCSVISKATVENSSQILNEADLGLTLTPDPNRKRFIEETFAGIFFKLEDLQFLDLVSWNLKKLENPLKESLVTAALIRSCVKRQPRGVFTVAGDPEQHKDNRRDLKLSLEQHFFEQVDIYNSLVFDNGQTNLSLNQDIFELRDSDYDLVYMDPPYVPRSDDNCYMKRYHFLEGLSCYWESQELLLDSKVRKIKKPFTPFSYRRTAIEAFEMMFEKFRESTLLLSYSSNGFPSLELLVELMGKVKTDVSVFARDHRYHFGNHKTAARNKVKEYLILGI